MNIKVTLDGANGIAAALEGFAQGLAASAAEGLQKGCEMIAADAKALCPVDTGELRASISSSAEQTDGGAVGRVSATAGHALFVEMGTRDKGAASSIGKELGATYTPGPGGQEAQPYLYPAYKQNTDNAIAMVGEAIMKGAG